MIARLLFFFSCVSFSSLLLSCSIAGMVGNQLCREFILEALERLEYRGYDSAGIACITEDARLVSLKTVGMLQDLKEKLATQEGTNGYVGIGHMRWATHGGVEERNAHPHTGCAGKVAVVHNGIIENYHTVREQLQKKGHTFLSATDTEVISHLLEDACAKESELEKAVLKIIGKLEGTYAFLALTQQHPDTIIAVRKQAPLCIGVGEGAMYLSSDPLAFTDRTNKVIFLPDQTYALLTKSEVRVYDFKGNKISVEPTEVDVRWKISDKDGHEHYMLKEIYEQKRVISSSLELYQSYSPESVWQELGTTPEQIMDLDSITIVGCGTSWHAARIAQFFFESVCNIPTHVYLASEFRYMPFFPNQRSLYILVSQSGETADTLEAQRLIASAGMSTIALTNVATSTLARESTGKLLTKAGPEVAVASTKAFTTQLTAFYWLAHRIGLERGTITYAHMRQAVKDIRAAAIVLEHSIERYKVEVVQKMAPFFASLSHVIFLGRHVMYPFALEASLKLKEISYIFSQCYPSGELKHGPLALVDNNMSVILFSHLDPVIYQKVVGNAQEVKARGGKLIAFVFEGQTELERIADISFVVQRVHPLLAPMAMIGLMQFIAYQVAKERGCPIDKPRNLAKSVTVE